MRFWGCCVVAVWALPCAAVADPVLRLDVACPHCLGFGEGALPRADALPAPSPETAFALRTVPSESFISPAFAGFVMTTTSVRLTLAGSEQWPITRDAAAVEPRSPLKFEAGPAPRGIGAGSLAVGRLGTLLLGSVALESPEDPASAWEEHLSVGMIPLPPAAYTGLATLAAILFVRRMRRP